MFVVPKFASLFLCKEIKIFMKIQSNVFKI